MVLDAKDRLFLMPKAFHGLVIQIDPIHLHLRGKRFRIHRKPVVLRSDFDPPAFEIFYRLIAATVPELQFEGLSAKGLAKDLMPEANPKNRNVAFDEV